jgi:peptidoglycan/xylan/chitin deacetylase (PgdA/CDA1 family)
LVPISRRSFNAGLFAAALTPIPRPHKLLEPHMRLASNAMALTLDACGGATDTRILNALLDRGIPTTIFATALWLHANPEAIQTLLAHPTQFNVQNHGERHLPAVLGSQPVYGLAPAGTLDAIRREVERGAGAIVAAGFPPPTWYRCATARYSPEAIELIGQMGFQVAGFSVNADAGASLPAPTVTRHIDAATAWDVIIAHINQPHRPSGAGVAAAIATLDSTRFVTLAGAQTTAVSS